MSFIRLLLLKQTFFPVSVLKVLLRYAKPYRWYFFGAISAAVLVSCSSVIALALVERGTAAFISAQIDELSNILIITAVVFTFFGFITFIQVYLSAYVGQRVATDMRQISLQHVLGLSIAFQNRQKTGDLMSRIHQDIQIIQHGMGRLVTRLIRSIFMPPVVIGYLFYLNWKLTLLSVFVLPAFIVILGRLGKKMRNSGHQTATEMADMNAVLQEILANLYIIKSFGTERHEAKRFERKNETYFHTSMRQNILLALERPIVALFQMFSFLAVIWYGGWLLADGQISQEQVMAFLAGLGILVESISSLSKLHMELQQLFVSVERFTNLCSNKNTVVEIPEAVPLRAIDKGIQFNNVCFRYEEQGDDILKNINFEIPVGKAVALVGPSGAGKTTLINLVLRLYDPTKGEILINNQNLRKVTLSSLRKKIGVVPQNVDLFAGTIRDNIAYGMRDATNEEIEKAAKMANADGFISRLPDGYLTPVGERGLNLSGGERQRIAIARVFLRDPPILIMDEATAYQDAGSEQLIQQSLQQLLQNRTAVIIAHRLATVQKADNIVVFDQGRIVEAGSHHKLMRQSGLYKQLYQQQFKDVAEIDEKVVSA